MEMNRILPALCAILVLSVGLLFAQPRALIPQDRTPQVEPRAKAKVSDATVVMSPHLTSRTCMIQITPPVGKDTLAVGHNLIDACPNEFGADWAIKTVSCYADSGDPTVTVRLKTGTTLTQAPIPCGDHTWKSSVVVGAPLLHSFSELGSTCSEPPCDMASATIATINGVSHYAILRITGQL